MTEIPESRRAMGRAFVDLPREHGFEPCEVGGSIPPELVGTLYRNGPGLFSLFGHDYESWLDGDGAISAFRFAGGRATAAARITVTPELAEERAAKQALYSSGFTKGPSWWKRVGGQQKNPTNIHVLSWHDRVFATTDAGPPIEIDPWTLETVGPWKLGGALRMGSSAHWRRCPRTGSTFLLGVSLGVGVDLDVYELPRAGEPKHLTAIRMPSFPLVHDFALTQKHLLAIAPPLTVGVLPFLAGTGAPAADLHWNDRGKCTLLVIERVAPHAVRRIELDPFFLFHLGPALARDDGTIELHLCVFDRVDLGSTMTVANARSGAAWVEAAKSHWERAIVDPVRGTVRRERVVDDVCEMPTFPTRMETQRVRYAYPMVTRDHRDVVGKLDLERGTVEIVDLGPQHFPGEVTFVPRGPGEDEGWLLTQVYDAARHRSGVVGLDARRIGDGPAFSAWLPHHVPIPIHGTWVPGVPGV